MSVTNLQKGHAAYIEWLKKNHLVRHGIFDDRKRAEKHLQETIPEYVAKGFFIDKTLTADDFEIVEDKGKMT